MTWDELLEEIVRPENYCTSLKHMPNFSGAHICSTLDKELRRADAERSRKNYYYKRQKEKGLTDAQIDSMPRRRTRLGGGSPTEFNFDPPAKRKVVAK